MSRASKAGVAAVHAPALASLLVVSMAAALFPAAAAAGAGGKVAIGTKHFTEQLILGEILAQLLESEGIPVERRFNLQGTLVCFEALRRGDLDLYPEYTGTGLVAMLHADVPSDPRVVAETGRVPAPFSAYSYPLLKFSKEGNFTYKYQEWPSTAA